MTANPHTDQLAAEVAAKRGADPLNMAQAKISRDLAAYLAKVLPDLAPEAIGAVALHASSCLGGLLSETARRQGRDVEKSAVLTVNLLSIAGEMLYHGKTKTAPDTRPLIERLPPDDAERLRALIDERDSWRTEVLGLRARVAELETERDREFAWHELHRAMLPDPFGIEPESLGYQLYHDPQCQTLPRGAVCWANHEPYKHWWPTPVGVYRIRPVEWVTGSGPDGDEPNHHLSMEIQARVGEEWIDWDGPALGDQAEDDPSVADVFPVTAASLTWDGNQEAPF